MSGSPVWLDTAASTHKVLKLSTGHLCVESSNTHQRLKKGEFVLVEVYGNDP